MDQKSLVEQHKATAASAVSDFIIPLLPGVLASILADPARLKKFRKVLIQARDILNQALPQG